MERRRVGSRITRRYDAARTPLDRLADFYGDQAMPQSVRALLSQRDRTDPFELAETIERELEQIDGLRTQTPNPHQLSPKRRRRSAHASR